MKLLFCGPLEDFSGYATFSRNYLKMLSTMSGVDLVARALRYDRRDENEPFEVPAWQQELMRKELKDIEIIIQNTTLNVEACPKPGVLNAIFFFWETDRIPPEWVAKANQFDFIMVPCVANAEALNNSGVVRPVLVMPPPFDMSPYTKEYEPLDIPNAGDRTIFYNICQLSAKKGIDALLRAYYAAFADRPDDVLLVLKTYVDMQKRNNELERIKQYIDTVKHGCRIPIDKYPPVMPIVDIWGEDDIHRLHRRGDCYVCSSRGEGFCIPVFEAMAHGTSVISHGYGGLNPYVNKDTAMLYNACRQQVFEMPHGDPSLYTGVEVWHEPSTADMSQIMRSFHALRMMNKTGEFTGNAAEQWAEIEKRRETAKNHVFDRYDIAKVGPLFEPHLNYIYDHWKKTGRFDLQVKVPEDGNKTVTTTLQEITQQQASAEDAD